METTPHHSTHVLNPASVWRGCTVLVWGQERGAGDWQGSSTPGRLRALNLDVCRDGRPMRKFKQGNNTVEETRKRICGIDAEKGRALCNIVAFPRVVRPRPPLRRKTGMECCCGGRHRLARLELLVSGEGAEVQGIHMN